MIEELRTIKITKEDMKRFGITIGILLLLLSGFFTYYDKGYSTYIATIASISIILGLFLPKSLKFPYTIWMKFSIVLGWIMTRVILCIIFYLILTPISLIARLVGEDFLALKKTNSMNSYWNHRAKSEEQNQRYEKQF